MIAWLAMHGPVIVTVAFFVGFVGIVLWAYLPANRQRLENLKMIPLEERHDG